jgi:hypothetical protein
MEPLYREMLYIQSLIYTSLEVFSEGAHPPDFSHGAVING